MTGPETPFARWRARMGERAALHWQVAAQRKAAAFFKAKKSYEIDVYLCEKDGKEIPQSTCF